jgi:DNA-directed RNA polymerase specialized sigma subunit
MTGREALEDIRRTDAEVNALLAYRNSLLDMLLSGYDPSRERVQEQLGSKVERSALRWLEVTEEIDRKTDQLIDNKNLIIGIIEQMPDRRHRDILMRRYAECCSWEKVAELTMYTRQQVWRLHCEAVEEFGKVFEAYWVSSIPGSMLKYIEDTPRPHSFSKNKDVQQDI